MADVSVMALANVKRIEISVLSKKINNISGFYDFAEETPLFQFSRGGLLDFGKESCKSNFQPVKAVRC